MELNKQVCSLELSKRLRELGVKQESLFYWNCGKKEVESKVLYGDIKSLIHSGDAYSSFTVAELGEMLPGEIKGSVLNIYKRIDGWTVNYGLINKEKDNTEANARAKMLIYLLENKLI